MNQLNAGITLSHARTHRKHKVEIQLNKELLESFGPRETMNTLVHEMIHAYLILKKKEDKANDGHGNNFRELMKKANEKHPELEIAITHRLNRGQQ